MLASGPVSSQQSDNSRSWALMPVTFHSSHQRSEQKCAAADTDSEPQEAKKTTRGQKSRGIDQFMDIRVRQVAEQASIMIRRRTLFDNPFLEDVDEMAAALWIKAQGLWKFDDSVPQQLAHKHVADGSPLDFLWYQC